MTSLVAQVAGMSLSDVPSPLKANPPAPPDGKALQDMYPLTEDQPFRFVRAHAVQSAAPGNAGDAENGVRNVSAAAGIADQQGRLRIEQNAGKAVTCACRRTQSGANVDAGVASNVERGANGSNVERELVNDRPPAPSPGGAARSPRFAAVAQEIRGKAITGPNVVAKLRTVFDHCGLSLNTHFKILRKHGRRPRLACAVLSEGEALGWASAATEKEAMLYACHVVWNTFEGFSKFSAVAQLIKDGPITNGNALKKLPAAFRECGLWLENWLVRLSLKEQEPDTFLCVVSCDGEILGHGMAANADSAKRSAFGAVLERIASGRDVPKFEAPAQLIRTNVAAENRNSFQFQSIGNEGSVRL